MASNNERSGFGFIGSIDLNYRAAINYYRQKQMQFLAYIKKDDEKISEKIIKDTTKNVYNQIISIWKEINTKIIDSVDIEKGRTGKYTIKDNIDINKIQCIPADLKGQIIASQQKDNIYSMLGNYFEQWLRTQLQNLGSQTVNSSISKILNFLSQTEFTGNIALPSAIRQTSSIRPDLAIGMNVDMKSNFVGYSLLDEENKEALPAELSIAFNIQNHRIANESGFKEDDISVVQLKRYLNVNMYGFSVKRWTEPFSGSHELTSASGMRKKINDEFKNKMAPNKTVNINYAYRLMLLVLSQYIIDILGPINIAYITGEDFIWADQFLENALLSMNLYTETASHSKSSNEVLKPQVLTNQIYIEHKRNQLLNTIFTVNYNEVRFKVPGKNAPPDSGRTTLPKSNKDYDNPNAYNLFYKIKLEGRVKK